MNYLSTNKHYTVGLGYIASLQFAKFIRYIQTPLYTRELLSLRTKEIEKNLPDIFDYPIYPSFTVLITYILIGKPV